MYIYIKWCSFSHSFRWGLVSVTFSQCLVSSVTLSLSKSSIRSCCFHRLHRLAAGLSIFCVLIYTPYISLMIFYIKIYSHDNSYLSMEYNNWVHLIDLILWVSIQPQEGSIERGTSIILMHYDYYRRTSW